MTFDALPPVPFKEELWEMLRKTQAPILVYGMGNGADKLIARLAKIGKSVSDFFASDGFVRGQSFHGKRVLTFAEAKAKHPGALILVSFGSTREEVLDLVFGLSRENELYIPDMPLAGEEYFTAEFYESHHEEIKKASALFSDDASRKLFCALLWYKLTGKPECLLAATHTGDEECLLGYSHLGTAVDVGAYRGDTLCELLSAAPTVKTVFALEPDAKNFAKLLAVAATYEDKEILCHHAAAWNEDGVLSFASSGNRNATVGAQIGVTASHKHHETTVNSAKIDTITCGRTVDYIKYDTEGAEREALLGSCDTIRLYHPYLRLSVYHRSEDLFALPLLLARMTDGVYRFYLRRRRCIPAWEIELIAVPVTQKGETDA